MEYKNCKKCTCVRNSQDVVGSEGSNDSFRMDVDTDIEGVTISVSNIAVSNEEDAVLVVASGFILKENSFRTILLSKDNCIKLIRALSTAASLLR